jgi:thymidylate synthase (FAD)
MKNGILWFKHNSTLWEGQKGMKIIAPDFIIESPVDGEEILKGIEKAGRTAYKSEDKITRDSAFRFVSMIIKKRHESVLEHRSVTVRVICDRGVSHEIVRHRLASYTQESTRYCNYSQDKFKNEIVVIKPVFWDEKKDAEKFALWKKTVKDAEKAYLRLLELGATPEEARSVLPNSLKTEIVMTMNLREWRNFFKLRTDSHAHPQMREIAIPLLARFQNLIPVLFDDLVQER